MKLKILTAISIIVFTIFMTALFTLGFVSYTKNKENSAENIRIQNANNKLADATASDDPSVAGVLSIETVAAHSKSTDCWMIIDNNVYDMTRFAGQHPGGSDLVIQYCGNDATDAFNTRDRNPSENHSSFARNLLRSYYIGPVGRVPDQLAFPNTGNNLPFAGLPVGGKLSPVSLLIPTITSGNTGQSQTSVVIDSAEVGKHATLQNCWMIVSGKVYDITSFISSHPGGQGSIAPYCGKDGTSAFLNRGGTGSHSSYAYNLLGSYLIANLGSTVSVSGGGSANTVANSGAVAPTAVITIAPTVGMGNSNTTPTPISQNQNLTLTTAEISTHNTLQNCWLIVSNKVYNVTAFISQHPGGRTSITNYCGKESTSPFQSRGGSGSHSSYAYSLLNNYLIGTVGSSVAVNSTSTPTPVSTSGGTGAASTPTSVPAGGSCVTNIPQSICSLYLGSTVTKKSGGYEDNNSWEGEVFVNGSCRHIKTNSSGAIASNQSC